MDMPVQTSHEPKQVLKTAREKLNALLDECISDGSRTHYAATRLRPIAMNYITRLLPENSTRLSNDAMAEKLYRGQQMLTHYHDKRGSDDWETQGLELALSALEQAAEALTGRDIIGERLAEEKPIMDEQPPQSRKPPIGALNRPSVKSAFPTLNSRLQNIWTELNRQIDTVGEMTDVMIDRMPLRAGKYVGLNGVPIVYIDQESYTQTLKPHLLQLAATVAARTAQAAPKKTEATAKETVDRSWRDHFTGFTNAVGSKSTTTPVHNLRTKIDAALAEAIARGDKTNEDGGYAITVNDCSMVVRTDDWGGKSLLFVSNDTLPQLEAARRNELALNPRSKPKPLPATNVPEEYIRANFTDAKASLTGEGFLSGVVTRAIDHALKTAKTARMPNADGSYDLTMGRHKITVLEIEGSHATRHMIANGSMDAFMQMAEDKRGEMKASLDRNGIGGEAAATASRFGRSR